MPAYNEVTADELAEIGGIDDWRYAMSAIYANFLFPSFALAAEFVRSVSDAAEAAEHHPDIDLRYPGRVRVALTTHAVGGVTTHDVALARQVSALAREAGAAAEPTTTKIVEFAIDTTDADRIRPFWQAVLGYKNVGGALVDPLRIGPPMWFQEMTEPRTERSRFHIDVTVPHDVAEQRVAEAIAAGGTLVTDKYARSWWVLADADGNEACVCTWQDRS
jgi:4a-hydroxytetrahydrobiopterin dehydratase